MSIMNPASVVKIVNGATQTLKSTLRRAAFLNLLPLSIIILSGEVISDVRHEKMSFFRSYQIMLKTKLKVFKKIWIL